MKILIFGDDYGIPMILQIFPSDVIVGCVIAEIRPQQYGKIRQITIAQKIPLLIQPKHNSENYHPFFESVKALSPDLFLVNSYSMLLRADLLSIPRFGGINIHGGLLPQYRGANPIQWAIINNETEAGVTMHVMDEHFDTGDIIAQKKAPVFFNDTWVDVHARIKKATESMLKEMVPSILEMSFTIKPQDETEAHYFRHRKADDGLIHWDSSVLDIYNLIRAVVKPYPGCFYYQHGKKVILDSYQTIAQIISLKFGPAGEKTLKSKTFTILPVNKESVSGFLAWKQKSLSSCARNPENLFSFIFRENYLEDFHLYNDRIAFELRFKNNNDLAGFCALHEIDYGGKSAKLDIFIRNDIEKKVQYRAEAHETLSRFAFRELNIQKVITTPQNNTDQTITANAQDG